jgi:hypothetical protein
MYCLFYSDYHYRFNIHKNVNLHNDFGVYYPLRKSTTPTSSSE